MRIVAGWRTGAVSYTVSIETEPGLDEIELFDMDGVPAGVLSFNSQAECDAAEALLCAEAGGNA